MAFTKQGSMWVWIDTESRLLVLDTSSQGRADEVVSLLVESLPGLSVSLINTQTSPRPPWRTGWPRKSRPWASALTASANSKARTEAKAVVRYARHPLDIEEIRPTLPLASCPPSWR